MTGVIFSLKVAVGFTDPFPDQVAPDPVVAKTVQSNCTVMLELPSGTKQPQIGPGDDEPVDNNP